MEELEKLISEVIALTELSLHESGTIGEDEKIANLLITPVLSPNDPRKFIIKFNTANDNTTPIFLDNESILQINEALNDMG